MFGELKAECLELRECSEELRGAQGKQWGQGTWTPTSVRQGRAEADLGRGMTSCVLCKQLRAGQDCGGGQRLDTGDQRVVTAIMQVSHNGSLNWGPRSRPGESWTEWRRFGFATNKTC